MLGQQRSQHIVSVGGLAQIVAGPTLDRFHSRGDARIASQDQHLHLRVQLEQLGQQHQSGVAFHLQIQHGVVRQVLLGHFKAFFRRPGDTDVQTAAAHGACHDASKGRIVVYQQQMRLFFAFVLQLFGHVCIPRVIIASGQARTEPCGRRSSVRVPPSS